MDINDLTRFGTKLTVGSVVQINPEFEVNKAFRGCMLTVTEMKVWGVIGFVQALGTRDKQGGQAFIRIKFKDIEYVGEAPWLVGTSPGI